MLGEKKNMAQVHFGTLCTLLKKQQEYQLKKMGFLKKMGKLGIWMFLKYLTVAQALGSK